LKIEIGRSIEIKLDDRIIGLSSIDDLVELKITIDEYLKKEHPFRCLRCKFEGWDKTHFKAHMDLIHGIKLN
jgi:hypothetical protein